MILPATAQATPWPRHTISGDQDLEPLDRALNDLMNEDQWVDDFIKRLNYRTEDIVCKE
jgi:hypothetical protein